MLPTRPLLLQCILRVSAGSKNKSAKHTLRADQLQFLVSFPKPTRLAVGLGQMGSVLRYNDDSPRVPGYGTLGSPVLPFSVANSRVDSFGVIKLSTASYYVKTYKEVIKMRKHSRLCTKGSDTTCFSSVEFQLSCYHGNTHREDTTCFSSVEFQFLARTASHTAKIPPALAAWSFNFSLEPTMGKRLPW